MNENDGMWSALYCWMSSLDLVDLGALLDKWKSMLNISRLAMAFLSNVSDEICF